MDGRNVKIVGAGPRDQEIAHIVEEHIRADNEQYARAIGVSPVVAFPGYNSNVRGGEPYNELDIGDHVLICDADNVVSAETFLSGMNSNAPRTLIVYVTRPDVDPELLMNDGAINCSIFQYIALRGVGQFRKTKGIVDRFTTDAVLRDSCRINIRSTWDFEADESACFAF